MSSKARIELYYVLSVASKLYESCKKITVMCLVTLMMYFGRPSFYQFEKCQKCEYYHFVGGGCEICGEFTADQGSDALPTSISVNNGGSSAVSLEKDDEMDCNGISNCDAFDMLRDIVSKQKFIDIPQTEVCIYINSVKLCGSKKLITF